MSNPTSNFGWQMPTNTDLVSQLPADFEVFGQAVDTSLADLQGGTTGQVLAKASNADMDFTWATDASGIPATIFDAKGDIIAASAADTAARLAVGANGTVLTADSGETTGLKWAAPAGATGYTLLNAGGTTLNGSGTVTISAIAAKSLFIYYTGATCGTVNTQISLRFNADTAANYTFAGFRVETNSSYNANNFSQLNSGYSGGTSILLNKGSNDNTQQMSGSFQMNLTDQTGWKALSASFGGNTVGTGAFMGTLEGFYEASAAITSISLISSAGNFTGGTIYVLGAN